MGRPPAAKPEAKAPLTVERVLQELFSVRDSQAEPTRAHRLEARLHRIVLEAIADGNCEGPPEVLASLALETRQLQFRRLYAVPATCQECAAELG